MGVDPLARGVEGKGGGEIERERDHQREDDGGAGKVEVVDHRVGEQAAGDAFDGQGVAPEKVCGSRPRAAGAKTIQRPRPSEAGRGGAGGALAHPAEADAAEDDGEEECGDADGLEDGVGEPGADEAGPVVAPSRAAECGPARPPTVLAEGSVGV